MAELQIACLGDFQVILAGTALTTFQTDKSRALLAYLALERREHQRTKLAQFLWSGYSEESARNSLRQVLYQLRQLLQTTEVTPGSPPPWLLLTRQTVQINPDAPISVDVVTFTQLLAECAAHTHHALVTCAPCLARLRQAVDLYQGDFLRKLSVIDSDEFEEWRRLTQEQLHIQMLNALTHLATAAEAAGDDEGAIQTAHRLLTLEPWLEAAHRQIMRLLAQRGQRAAALAQYQRCRQVLAEELGGEPDDETTALYEQIRNSQPQAQRVTAPVTAPPSPPLDQPDAPVKPAAWLAHLPPLLGRADELAHLATLLDQPTCHLVTLVGPPGVGKTRLAQAVLAVCHFEHGGYFIELATLRDPTLLATTIAHALSAAHPTLQFTGERLSERLRDQELLLVLDNFEQVLPGVTLVGELLAHCPRLKLLLTSRAPLHLGGEQVITVHPLPLPALTAPKGRPPQDAIDLATVARNAAVQLFCQRAAAVVPGFTLTERLAPVVVEICRRLDGLPLAIELAAAHSRLLPPPALLERLTQRLALLTSRSQARPERQQTLRAAIAWSYELLDAAEQRLFRQLAVFVGGATLSAIEAVIGNGAEADAPVAAPHALLAGLEALLDKNLLRQAELPPAVDVGEPRMLMLETLREYGWELLAAAEDGDPVTQKRHADYFLWLAETTAPKLHGPDQVAWLDQIALDHDNLRAALAWFVQANEVHKALRLATALRYFWRVRGHYREGCDRLLAILAQPEAAPTGGPTDAVRARALNAAGYLQWVQGNTTAAQKLLQEALALGRAVPDAAATAFALRYLGLAAEVHQERAVARQWLEESLAIYRTLDTPNETALALMYLGDAAFSQQAYDEAQRLYQESAELLRHLGNNVVLPYALRHLGYLGLARGDRNAALRLCTESLRLNLAAGEQQGSAAAVTALAFAAAAGECWAQAARLLACVTAWLTASGAQLLPLDRTYYEQTQRLLQQQPQQPIAAERLSLEQALAYVLQELTFDDEPGRQGDLVTSTSSVTQSPNHPVTLSPGHPLSPSPLPPHNLPAAHTPFIGRTHALAEIVSRLQTAQLLTLVGPGGMGKTRLAVEVGRERLVAFADGVWFVPLASISTPAALAGAIATVLEVTFQGGDPRSALLQSLRPKHLLLILDNFEQLLPAGAEGPAGALDLVVELLEAAPRVQILVTSRQRLNLRSEQIYAVPALSFAANATLAEAAALAAVRLFVQTVQRGQANFQLTDANLAAVLRICQLVQGMPLGLELAAANAVGAPLTAIANAIEQSAEFLAVGWRELPERQRSMRAVFAWSWRLLSAAEQHILRQSAIFRGGFTYSAAQAVMGATIPLLTRLTHKSLLQWQATTTGEGSYAIHELLRQFAAEELAATGDEQAVATRHSEYYLAFLTAQQQSLLYHAPRQAIHTLSAELDNIRQAWRWGAGHLSAPLVEQSALTLREFCLLTGLITEGVELFTLAAQARRDHLVERQPLSTPREQQAEERLYSILLGLLGNVLIMAGRHEEALQQATVALQFAADDTNPEGVALAYLTQGQALRRQGKSAQAQQLLAQVVQLAQAAHGRANNPTLLLDLERRAYSWLTSIALSSDDYPLAKANISRQLDICRRLQKFAGEAMALTDLVDIEITLGNYAQAQQYAEQALTAARKADFRWAEAACLGHLADLAQFQGDYTQAQPLYEQVLTLYQEMGHLLAEAVTSAKLGQLHLQFGDVDRAHTRIEQAFHLLRSLGMPARETCTATLSRAWLSYLRDQPAAALVDAEEGWQMAQQLDGGASQAAALILVGLIRERLQQAVEAATAYQAALTIYLALGHHHQTVEPRAGLARLALAAGDLARAHAEVAAILPILIEQPRAGYNNPYSTYLTCYRVLAAHHDPRAATLLQQGYTLLQQDAAQLDEERRQRFLTGVASHRELVAAYAALQTPSAEPQSQPRAVALPLFATPLVGRAQAIAEIGSQLQRPEVRLITLMGPGGMGKTRLAIEVGREQIGAFVDGVWFVALAPISNASALPAAIATTLGIALQGDDPRGLLLQLLRPKRLLLILDNFEHLLAEDGAGVGDALDLLVDLLNAAPGVQMLVTSRERLKLRGEQVYPVQALPFVEQATLAEATTSAAVRLFVDSVQRMQADFQLTATNLPAVLRICQLVQGMPLGLELAAANAGSAPLRAIADALEQSAEILAVEWRDLPARQRSMRAVFAWSWQLLSAAEQRILRQCALFRGGFDYTAAQAVIGATPLLLTALVDKSLLQWQAAAPGEGRYAMHELLRQFAAEALAESDECAMVEERHGRYYLAYLAARSFRLGRGEPKEASAEIQVELENVRLAWHWAATQGALVELDQALYAWWQFCLLQGLGEEARQSLAAALAGVRAHLTHRADDAPLRLMGTRLLAKLLALHANFLFAQGRDEEMAAQAREAMQLGAASGGFEGEILGTYVLGRVLQDAEQKREAQTLWEETLQLIGRHQPQQPENELLHELHWMTHEMLRGSALHFGDYAGCRAHIVEALRICQTLGKQRGELSCLSCLGEINFFLYDFAAAEADYQAELTLGRSLGYRLSEMSAQEGLARIARLRGDYTTALTLLEQSLSTATELAFHYDQALWLAALIRLHCQLGDQTAATAGQNRLTQLLAQVQLGKECRLYACLAAATKAHYAGDKDKALAAAEQAHQINQQGGDILFRLVDTALILGHVRAAAGQWEAAQSAFQEALTAFQQFAEAHGAQALSAEPQAGLAQIALAQSDLAGAQAHIEAILPVLVEEPRAGYNNPFFIYLTAYRVLAANHDPRAATVLQQGYHLLQQDAAALDEASRQRFLTGVTIHRDLMAAYTAMQTQGDKVTSDKVTSDKVTSDKVTSDKVTRWQGGKVMKSHPFTPSPLLDWAEMPMVDFFAERTAEVAQLTAWLTPTATGAAPARLVSILGMGGMGKTTLAALVTKAVAPSFQVVIWRSLINAPPLSELLRNWLHILSRQTLTTPPGPLDEQLRLLLTYLQQERCLLVLDNVESIFAADPADEAAHSRAGVARPGYEGYDQLLQRLASSDHQSCLLLTSREQPYALLRAGRQAQMSGRVQVLPLVGLDQQAGSALLQSNGLHTSAAQAAQLVQNYSGNPLALQIVAATIADFFGGDVAAFQQEEGQIFDGVRLVLDQQFARLSPLERDILVWLAIEREAITVPMLRSNFVQPVATAPLLEALQALQNRSLLEKRDAGFTLQNVIIEYTTDYLVEQVYREIVDDKRTGRSASAAEPWQGDSGIEEATLTLSFLNRFALLKAQSKEYVRQSQARLILQPVGQQLLTKLGRQALVTRLAAILAQLRAAAPRTPGYAAGNLLNLFLALEVDLPDYDFSNLCVWQPYLRETTLPQLNFTNADLRGAAFTDTFDIVRGLAYSPDGRVLAAGTSDGEIRLWRATDGQLLANVKGHGDIVSWLCFLDDGKTLISYSHDLALAVWQVGSDVTDAAAGAVGGVVTLQLLYRNIELSNLTNMIAFHPQGELLAFATERGWLCLWHLGPMRCLSEQTLNVGQIHTLRFHPDGKTLALGASDRRIHLWDVDAGAGRLALRQTLAETPAIARDLSFRPDGRTLASGHEDGSIYLWQLDAAGDCATGQAVQVLSGHRAGVWRLAFSPDGQLLASGSDDHSVRLWKMGGLPAAVSAQPLARFDEHRGWVHSLAFSPDGLSLASAGADRTLRVWDLRHTQLLYTLYGYVKAVKSIAFCPNSRLLVSGSDDQRVRLWSVADSDLLDVASGHCLQAWAGHTGFIWQVAVSPDGRMVASAGDDRQIYVRDASSGQILKILSGHAGGATAVAFSPDSKLLASGGLDCRVIVWDVASGALIRTWNAGTQVVWTVAFSPNGEYLAFGGEPNRVRLWHLPTQQFYPALENKTGVLRTLAFSPDSTWLAAGGHDAIVYLWQVGSAASPILLAGHQHRIRSVAFSPDGRRLATASFDQTVRLWDLQNQTQIRTLLGHSNQVLAVAFSTDGTLLASASEDETIRLWHGEKGEPLSVLPIPGPYAGMKITGVTGISAAQKAALKALGAVEE